MCDDITKLLPLGEKKDRIINQLGSPDEVNENGNIYYYIGMTNIDSHFISSKMRLRFDKNGILTEREIVKID
jgi:hypothetical protein